MRESGYYWVLPPDTMMWEIADYNEFLAGGVWFRYGTSNFYSNKYFAEIGQRIPDNETLKKLNHEHTT